MISCDRACRNVPFTKKACRKTCGYCTYDAREDKLDQICYDDSKTCGKGGRRERERQRERERERERETETERQRQRQRQRDRQTEGERDTQSKRIHKKLQA